MITIIIKLFLESIKAISFRLAFGVVSERFLSRLVCYALRRIADKSTNDFTVEAAETFIEALKRKDLPEIK